MYHIIIFTFTAIIKACTTTKCNYVILHGAVSGSVSVCVILLSARSCCFMRMQNSVTIFFIVVIVLLFIVINYLNTVKAVIDVIMISIMLHSSSLSVTVCVTISFLGIISATAVKGVRKRLEKSAKELLVCQHAP